MEKIAECNWYITAVWCFINDEGMFLLLHSAGLPKTIERSPNSWCSSGKCRISGRKSPAGLWFSGWEQPFLEGLWAQSYPYNVPAKLFVTYWQDGRNTKLWSRLGTWLISVLPWISWVVSGPFTACTPGLFGTVLCSGHYRFALPQMCWEMGGEKSLFLRWSETCCTQCKCLPRLKSALPSG